MNWIKFNPNPCGKSTGDCAVRAISAALNISWYNAYDLLCEEGRDICDMPSSDTAWGNLLLKSGFNRYTIPNIYKNSYTAREFIRDHKKGIYVLAFGRHVATAKSSFLLDSWNSLEEVPIYYYH